MSNQSYILIHAILVSCPTSEPAPPATVLSSSLLFGSLSGVQIRISGTLSIKATWLRQKHLTEQSRVDVFTVVRLPSTLRVLSTALQYRITTSLLHCWRGKVIYDCPNLVTNRFILRLKETPVEERLDTYDRILGMVTVISEVGFFVFEITDSKECFA